MRTDEPIPTLIWVDVETTGLDPHIDRLLEVAAVVTDSDLQELDVPRFHAVVGWGGDLTAGANPKVIEMHRQNGLLDECRQSQERLTDVDERFAAWLRNINQHATVQRFTLAGATPSFDQAVIAAQLPVSAKLFHYRLFDVSTLRQAALWWNEDTLGAETLRGREEHRAMSDIQNSLTLARNMRRAISTT